MEFESIERELRIDASPEVVYEVISSPGHIKQWWGGAEADLDAAAESVGELAWRDETGARVHVVPITVLVADPPRSFSFRWVYDEGEVAGPGNSLLVNFELVPLGKGTVLRLTESGFREKGWEAAVLEEQYQEHAEGWDRFVPSIGEYVARLVSTP